MKPAPLAGVVLAGGRSRRMRRNKALLPVDGEPLWQRQERILRAAGADLVWFALRPRQRSLGRRAWEIRDSVENSGPLAGIHAALVASPAPLLAVLAVDMPRIQASWFRKLRRAARAGRGAVFLSPHGYESLAAIFPREALAEATRRLRARDFAAHRLVEHLVRAGHLKVLRLTAREQPQTANWTRPGEISGLA
jgi:molybdopterin-guanine dinucleotide biosynthesis protein A